MVSQLIFSYTPSSRHAGLAPLPIRVATGLFLVFLGGLAHASVFIHTIVLDDRAVREPTSQVTVARNDDTHWAAPGEELLPGDVLITGRDAQVVLIRDGGAVEIFVQEESVIRISSIWVDIGEIYVRVKEALREKFEVESEYGVAGVEGTEFVVSVVPGVDRDVNYSCVTLEGTVVMRSPDRAWQPVEVGAGMAFALRAGSLPNLQELNDDELGAVSGRFEALNEIYREESTDIRVPSVVGLLESDAIQTLIDQRLLVGEIEMVLDSGAQGYVVGQVPPAGGNAAPYSLVTLAVEAEPTTVPELIDLKLEDAERALAEARLRKGSVTLQTTGERPANTIISQTPEPATIVPVDSAVDFVIEAAEPVRPNPPQFSQVLNGRDEK